MTTPITEQILALIETKLAGITTGGGYQETVLAANIFHPPEAPLDVKADNCPAITVRHNGTNNRWHLRAAEELLIEVDLVCVATTPDLLKTLMGDVKKLVYANPFWNNGAANLARRTWIAEERVHETEVSEATVTGSVVIHILARADRTNPFTTKAV
jgi:hypothetical protein